MSQENANTTLQNNDHWMQEHDRLRKQYQRKLVANKETEENILLWALKRIPLFSGLAHRLEKTGEKISNSIAIKDTHNIQLKHLSKAFHIMGLVFAIIEFVRLPFLIVAAIAQGKNLSVILPLAAKWFYAAVVLTLVSLAFAIPFLAPIMALTLAGLGLVTAFISLRHLFYERGQLQQHMVADKQTLLLLEKTRDDLLLEVSRLCKFSETLRLEEKSEQLEGLKNRLKSNEKERQSCLDRMTVNTQKLNALAKPSELGDKLSGILLSSAVLIGAAVSFFFPLAGFILLAVTAGAGFIYGVSRSVASRQNKTVVPRQQEAVMQPEYADDIEMDEMNTATITRAPDHTLRKEGEDHKDDNIIEKNTSAKEEVKREPLMNLVVEEEEGEGEGNTLTK